MDRLRETSADLLHIFEHAGTRPVHVGTIFKDHEYIRIVEHGLPAHGFYLWGGQKRGHDWVGNLIFDEVRRLAFPVGVNDHLHVRYVGKSVEWDVAERPDSRQHNHQSAGKNQETIICAPFNDSGDHVTYLLWHRRSIAC